jgi:hypothetical protein
MSLRLNIRQATLTPKVDKTELSGRSNWRFWFPHVRPMIQLLADAETQSSRSHLQRPSYIVGISDKGNSIQQHRFLLLDIQCPNPGDLHLWCFILMQHGLVVMLRWCNMSHFTQDQQIMSQIHLIVQHVLEKTASIQRVDWVQRKPRNSQTEQPGLGIQRFWFSYPSLSWPHMTKKGLSCEAKGQFKWEFEFEYAWWKVDICKW